jgi:integrase
MKKPHMPGPGELVGKANRVAKMSFPRGTFEWHYFNQVRPTIEKRVYRYTMDKAISRLRLWRGGPTPLSQMNDQLIDQYERALADCGMGHNAVKDYPQILRRILRKIDKKRCRPVRRGFPAAPYVIGPPGTLTHFAEAYCSQRDLAKASICQIRWAVVAFEKFLCRAGVLGDLNADTIGEWIAARLSEGKSRKTVHQQRGTLLQLWRQARRQKLLPPVEDVRIVKVPRPIPQAWFPDEFVRLLEACETITQRVEFEHYSVPWRIVLRAFLLTSYYTGLRPQDVLALRSAEVNSKGTLVVRQQKTGEAIDITLPPDCLKAIAATRPEKRELVFPLDRKRVWWWIHLAITRAKLSGSVKWLRRTGATRCEQLQPGSAKAYLGHLTDGLAYRHYVDRRQIKSVRPVPPSPFEGEGGTS